MLKTFTNLNNNDNNNLPMKQSYDKRDITFDKRYQDQLKPYDPKPLNSYEKPLALPLHSSFGPMSGLEQPIKLVKPLDRSTGRRGDADDDDDDDDHLLVIAHRENGNHDESDHESSERSDERADDSA